MEKYKYVLKNFFTYKDYLIDAKDIPGTLFTPLHIILYTIFLFLIVYGAYKIVKEKRNINKIFKLLFIAIVVGEIAIISWDTFAREVNHLDLKEGLSLYPCSAFLYIMPLIIWGKGIYKKMAYGYLGTVGLLGATINLIYPYKLESYSCLSFSAIHSMLYHGSMLFVLLILIFSKKEIYKASNLKELLYPTIPILLLSIPANLLNYSMIDSDYMYFKGYHPLAQYYFPNIEPYQFTILVYLFYIIFPILFYLPSYLKEKVPIYKTTLSKIFAN